LLIIPPLFWFLGIRKDKKHNEVRCETVKLELRGVITDIKGRMGYVGIRINNGEFISFDISANIKYRKLFDKHRYFSIGDSIIKEANSKDFTIKNGDSISILTLLCDD